MSASFESRDMMVAYRVGTRHGAVDHQKGEVVVTHVKLPDGTERWIVTRKKEETP